MTTKNTICVKCKHLDVYGIWACTAPDGVRSLISFCGNGGGKNAGDRKTCRKFEPADEKTIAERVKALEGAE